MPENVPVLGDVDNYEIEADDVFTCAVGTPQVRKKLIEKMLERGAEFVNVISQSAIVFPTAKIGLMHRKILKIIAARLTAGFTAREFSA